MGVVGVRVYYLSAAREVIRDVCFRQVAVKVALRLAVQNHDFFFLKGFELDSTYYLIF